MYFCAGTADHRLRSRVKIGTNWQTYTKIVGAGDLNGDGRGDLLGVDKAGALWRYYGTATGGVATRVKLAGGWGTSSTSVVGMGGISGDGKPDVVARDTAGKLFRFSGRGTGTLGGRAQIGNSGLDGLQGHVLTRSLRARPRCIRGRARRRGPGSDTGSAPGISPAMLRGVVSWAVSSIGRAADF